VLVLIRWGEKSWIFLGRSSRLPHILGALIFDYFLLSTTAELTLSAPFNNVAHQQSRFHRRTDSVDPNGLL
jgi:hypothetical protein